MAERFDLTGKIALITGGAGILGRHMAAALAGQGARVVVVDRDAAAIEARRAEAAAGLAFMVADISEEGAVAELHARVEAEVGAVDVLVNNAATKSEHFFEPFESFPIADWDEVMAVNLKAAVLCCQRFGGAMAERGAGAIVNILSIYGIVAPDQRIYEGSEYEGRAINTPAVYSASKAALWGLTKYLATYWGERGVRVNAVTPGGVFSGQNRTFVDRYAQRVPLGRMGDPADIAGAVCYLASDAACYVTGQNLVVDGGLTTW